MIGDFLTWWADQLHALLRARFTATAPAEADAVLVCPANLPNGSTEGGPIDLIVRKQGQAKRIGSYAFDGGGVHALRQRLAGNGLPARLVVRLPAGELLDKRLSLPLAAERDLGRVLRYEMDSETPFSADEVYWDWSVESRDSKQGKLTLHLFLIPHARLARLLGLLRLAGLEPGWIEAARGDGAAVTLPLVRHLRPAGSPGSLVCSLVRATCLALAIVAAAMPLIRQRQAIDAVDARIAAARPAADEALKLRAQLDGSAGAGGIVQTERARLADPLTVLAGLTSVLPDDTYLSDFVLKEHKINITGQSADATRLIGAIAGSAEFRNPSFAAPVTRIGLEGSRQDVFSITAEVRAVP
jgi:general secretion pathway protein L